jgi:hypothetical protein
MGKRDNPQAECEPSDPLDPRKPFYRRNPPPGRNLSHEASKTEPKWEKNNETGLKFAP